MPDDLPILSTSVSAVANIPGSSEHFLEILCLCSAVLHPALHEINISRIPENKTLLIFVALRCTVNLFHCSSGNGGIAIILTFHLHTAIILRFFSPHQKVSGFADQHIAVVLTL